MPRGINLSSLITLNDLDVFWSARQEPPTCNKNSNLAPVLCRGSPTVVLRHRPAATRVPHPTRPFPWINSKFSAFRCVSHSSLLCRRSDGVANSSGLRSHLKDAVLVKAHCTVAVIGVILNDEENRYSSAAIASSACQQFFDGIQLLKKGVQDEVCESRFLLACSHLFFFSCTVIRGGATYLLPSTPAFLANFTRPFPGRLMDDSHQPPTLITRVRGVRGCCELSIRKATIRHPAPQTSVNSPVRGRAGAA